ncbi:MAG TPA: ribonuclease R, partial [bacterium]|nr:ribonuclease R [bacterium]
VKKSPAGKPASSVPKTTLTGELRLHRDGYGFVVAALPGEEDVFIPAQYVGSALYTDVVEVRVVPGRRGKSEGRIERVVERRVLSLMGRIERTPAGYHVIADDRRVRHRIVVPRQKTAGAKHGANVVVKITGYPSGDGPMTGEVVSILGARGEDATEKSAVVARHQLKEDFPPEALREADAAFRLVGEGVYSGRRDMRDVPFVTIDGESAKDFDDAVAVERLSCGLIRLWVSIADVSFFVRPGTALDRAAYERATSVYFPGDCIPMLPKQLSENLCSLRPNEDRLTMTAEMDFDAQGNVVRSEFSRSVIQSRERMTYTDVKRILVDSDPQSRDRYRKVVTGIELMRELHDRLRAKRLRRGSIDFDLPEPEIVIDMQGKVSDIVRAERHVGHMMIEEFMIAANEAVAEFLTSRNAGCIYRVHEKPSTDKLQDFAVLMHNLGLKFRMRKEIEPGALARVVEEVRGRSEERLVNHMLLRSMSQAVYSPENLGHFGLASECYCHFTSPIRRYPDLVVHRLLTGAFGQTDSRAGGEPRARRPLKETAEHCSRRERIAMEAEREMAKLFAALFMQGHVGERFEGIISHLTKFGFFVELIDFFVEGLVRIEDIGDDRYRFFEEGMLIKGGKKGRTFKVGDRVAVEVDEVDIPDREIVFLLA